MKIWQKDTRDTPPDSGREKAVHFTSCFVTMEAEIFHRHKELGKLKLASKCG